MPEYSSANSGSSSFQRENSKCSSCTDITIQCTPCETCPNSSEAAACSSYAITPSAQCDCCDSDKIKYLEKEIIHYEKALQRRDCLLGEMQKKLKSSCDATINEMKRMVCDMEKLRNENINLKEELTKAHDKMCRRDRCIKQLQNTIQKHVETETCLTKTNEKLRLDNFNSKKQFTEMTNGMNALENELACKNRLIETFECKRTMEYDYKNAIDELNCYKNKYNEVNGCLKEVMEEKQQLHRRLTEQYRELKCLKNVIPPENVLCEAKFTIESHQKELKRMRERDAEQRSRITCLVTENERMERKIGKLQAQLIDPCIVSDLEKELREARTYAGHLDMQRKCYERKMQEEIQGKKMREDCLNKLREELQVQVQSCHKMMERFQQDKENLSCTLCNLKEDIRSMQAVLCSKDIAIRKAENDKNKVCCDLNETCSLLTQAKQKIDKLNRKMACLEDDLEQKSSMIAKQCKEIQCLNDELSQKDSTIKKINLVNSSLKSHLNCALDELDCKKEQLSSACCEVKTLRQNIECVKKELCCKVESLESRIEVLKSENECKQNKIYCMCIELDKVKQEASDCCTNLNACTETVRCLRETMCKKDELINDLRCEKDQMEVKICELETEVRELEGCRRRVSCLEAHVKNIEEKLKHLRCENDRIEKEDKCLEDKIACLQDRVIDLQSQAQRLEQCLSSEKDKNRSLIMKSQFDKQKICELEAINKDLEHINDKIENRLEEEAFKCHCVPNVYTPC